MAKFGHIGKILSLHWQKFFAIGWIFIVVNDQIIKKIVLPPGRTEFAVYGFQLPLRNPNTKEAIYGVVVAQLAERLLPIPEIRGSNPVIGKIFIDYIYCWKDENKEKEAGIGSFLKRPFK